MIYVVRLLMSEEPFEEIAEVARQPNAEMIDASRRSMSGEVSVGRLSGKLKSV